MNRTLAAALAITMLSASASSLRSQDMIVRGRVTTELGAPVAGAQIYINDLNAETKSDSSGNYSLVVPGDRIARVKALMVRQSKEKPDTANIPIRVRIRALGFLPDYVTIRITLGTQTQHFQLKTEPSARMDSLTAAGTRNPIANVEAPATQLNRLPQADPFGRFLFTPEAVMQYQDAIALRESQRSSLQAAMHDAQTQVIRLQWVLAQDGGRLTAMLEKPTLDEKEVLAQVDRIIAIEREIKRAQMTLLIKIKNTLTVEQQTKLRQLRGGEN